MPTRGRTICVFVSSTFEDPKAERMARLLTIDHVTDVLRMSTRRTWRPVAAAEVGPGGHR